MAKLNKELRLAAETKKRNLAEKLTKERLNIILSRSERFDLHSIYDVRFLDILKEEINFCCLAMGDQLESVVSNGN